MGSRPDQSWGTHLLLDALQALAQLVPLTGEVLVAPPDLLDLLQDMMDTPTREGGRRHQGEVEEKVEQPAKPARAGRRGRGGGGGGGGGRGAAAVASPVRLILRVLLRRVRRRRLRLLRRRRLLRHVIRTARRVGALVRGAGGAVAALGAPLFGRGHGGGGGGGMGERGEWSSRPGTLAPAPAGAALAARGRGGVGAARSVGRRAKRPAGEEEGAWFRSRRRGADPASREGRPSPAGAPATQAGRRPSSLRRDPTEGGRAGGAGLGEAGRGCWGGLLVPGLPSSGVGGADPQRCAEREPHLGPT